MQPLVSIFFMRKFLRNACIITASLLIPLSCLMLYAHLLLPEGSFYLQSEPLPFSASVNSVSDTPITGKSTSILGFLSPASAQQKQRRYVIPGGTVLGLKLYAKGVVVVAVDGVAGVNGKENPASQADLRAGDLLLKINDDPVSRNAQVQEAISNCEGQTLSLLIERDGVERTLQFTPALGADGTYKAGIWVRDSSAGIGTLTFTDPQTNMLAGLGHAIADVDSGAIIPISAGEVVPATVKGCYKGAGGKPGELSGVFNGDAFAALLQNEDTGVYGRLYGDPNEEPVRLPVAMRSEVKEGKAQIIATIDGDKARCYDAEIRKVYPISGNSRKNLILQITDPELIAVTGGIVQGMSGSPILQNGMLVGAVTHVFVNNPQQGYGIFAQTMLERADEIARESFAG